MVDGSPGGERPTLEDLRAAGAYDPAAPDAAEWRAVLERLIELGAGEGEIVAAHRRQHRVAFALELMLAEGRRRTLAEAAAEAGVDEGVARALWRCWGFADPGPQERRFGEPDVTMLRHLEVVADVVGRETQLQIARAIGLATARVAEAIAAALRSGFAVSGRADDRDVLQALELAVRELLPETERSMALLHRHHLVEVARRYDEWAGDASAHNVLDLVVGFADLTGSTALAQALDLEGLDHVVTAFEARTTDCVARHGATLAKRLGDAAMFVTPAPAVACAVALDLVAEFADDPDVPPVRVGLAAGEVVALRGDYYGPVVNLASRLLTVARPATVVVDDRVQRRVPGAADAYTVRTLGQQSLDGFDEPMPLYELRRRDG